MNMHDQEKSREQLLAELHALWTQFAPRRTGADGPPADGLPLLPPWVMHTLENLDDALFVLDREWRFIYLNAQAVRHARQPASALLGRSIWAKYPQLLGTALEAHYHRAMAEQKPAHFEMAGLVTGRWLEVHAYPSPDALVIYSRDASERKRAEEALRESEERFRQMAETIDEVFWLADADSTRILYVSPAYEVIWGRSRASLYAEPRSWLGAVHPEDRERVLLAFERQVQTGEFHEEYRIVRPDGTVRWVLDRAFPVRDEAGRPYRTAGISKDVTERRRAEAELRQSEARLRRFAEAAFEGLVIHAGGVILDVNQAACALFGCTAADLIGKSVFDFGAPETRDEVRRRIQAGDERPYEAIGRRKDGSTFPGEVRGRNITYRDRPARVTALRDLTERKRAEAELRDSARRLQLLSHRLLAVQEEERRRLARELHDEVAQVLVGLNYTLELSSRAAEGQREARLAEGREMVRELSRQVRDISQLLRPSLLDDLGLEPALAWHCRRHAAQTGLQVAFACTGLGGRLPAAVETAAYRIVQEALTNVARHAGVDRASVRVSLADGRLRLEVEDGGAGFDPEAVRAAAAGGGLSGIQERVALLGGRLTVESSPGAGARLTAELPVDSREEGGTHDVDPAPGR
jgi:PAS domain S-box-containing protein